MRTQLITLIVVTAAGALAALVLRTYREQGTEDRQTTRDISTDARGARPALEHTATVSVPRMQGGSSSRADVVTEIDTGGEVIGTTDPTSKDYDPITLVRVLNLRPRQIMAKEPRDSTFANARESALNDRLNERLRARLAFDVKAMANCRTSSCEVTVDGPSSVDEMNAALQALDIGTLGAAVQVGQNLQAHKMSIVLLYSASQRDPVAYDQLLTRYKAHNASTPPIP